MSRRGSARMEAGRVANIQVECDRLRRDKDALVRALRWASLEIHNPGAGRTSNIDLIEVINAAHAEHGK